MTTRMMLIAAQSLIYDPKKWAQGPPPPGKYCALTAINEIGRDNKSAYNLLVDLTGEPRGRLSVWNDSHTHADVIDLFDKAIEAAL